MLKNKIENIEEAVREVIQAAGDVEDAYKRITEETDFPAILADMKDAVHQLKNAAKDLHLDVEL